MPILLFISIAYYSGRQSLAKQQQQRTRQAIMPAFSTSLNAPTFFTSSASFSFSMLLYVLFLLLETLLSFLGLDCVNGLGFLKDKFFVIWRSSAMSCLSLVFIARSLASIQDPSNSELSTRETSFQMHLLV